MILISSIFFSEGYCGASEHYCNEMSIWVAGCEDLVNLPPNEEESEEESEEDWTWDEDDLIQSLSMPNEDVNEILIEDISPTPTITAAEFPSTHIPSHVVSSLIATSDPTESPTEAYDLDEEW